MHRVSNRDEVFILFERDRNITLIAWRRAAFIAGRDDIRHDIGVYLEIFGSSSVAVHIRGTGAYRHRNERIIQLLSGVRCRKRHVGEGNLPISRRLLDAGSVYRSVD